MITALDSEIESTYFGDGFEDGKGYEEMDGVLKLDMLEKFQRIRTLREI